MHRTAVLTCGLALAALGIVACGGSTHASSPRATAGDAGLKLARCMRANGVPDFPDPTTANAGNIVVRAPGAGDTMTVNGVPVGGPAFRSAMAACKKDAPSEQLLPAARFETIRRGALATARCMRSHGVPNYPDPVVSDGPEGLIVTGNLKAAHIDINSPVFQDAQRTCQPLSGLPAPPGTG